MLPDIYAIIFFIIFIIGILGIIYLLLIPKMPDLMRFEDEKYFLDPCVDPPAKCVFPSIDEPASLELSVIVPSYNEETRLPNMLNECLMFLEERHKTERSFSYEVIIVDDGSNDSTSAVALSYVKKYGVDKVRLLTLKKNRGKGGAVRLGMLSARGKYLLFADADGATKFCDIVKLEEAMSVEVAKQQNVVIVGSRAHLEKQAVATRSAFRTFLMYGFHMLVWIFGVRNVRDTQCGFKLFTRNSASVLFKSLHVERWAFDVELLYMAYHLGMAIQEVAVNWTEIEGSKLVPFWSWVQMGKDLLLIWLKYQIGLWKIPTKKKVA